jgi:uncharacterized protein YjdB
MNAGKTVLWCLLSVLVWIGCGDNGRSDLALDPSSLMVMVGEDAVIGVRRGGVEPATATWASSNEAVARVTADGGSATVRGVAPGTASITATVDGVTATATVTVVPSALVSIAITPPMPSIAAGTATQLTATGMFHNGTTADLTAMVTWSSASAAVATVDASGKLTGVAVGTAAISATVGQVKGTVTATVTAARLVAIDVTPPSPSLARGTTAQLTATGRFTDNTTQDLTAQVTWSSATQTVATVSSTGLVTAANVGTSVVTAAMGAISGTVTVTVTPAVLTAIDVTPTNPSVPRGLTQQLTATGRFSDSTTQDLTAMVTWTSATTTTATISNAAGSHGLATAANVGTTLITATSGAISGSTTLTVTPASLVSIQVTPVNPSIARGLTQQFTATGTFTDTTTQDLTASVTWTSSATTVATISNAAGSHGLATAANVGTATITATSGAISGSTTLTVTAATLVSIQVTPTNPSVARGLTRQLTATGTFTDTTTQDLTAAVTWTSSSTTVATVSNAAASHGLATGVNVGTAMITATSGAISGSTTLTVTPAVLVSIAVSPAGATLALGTTQQYTAIGTFSDASTQNLTTTVTWGSSNASVVQLSNAAGSQGLATTTGVGTAAVSATAGSVTGSTGVAVTAAALLSIAITPADVSIPKGLAQQYVAIGTYSDTTTQDLTTTVTWSSSDGAVAQISNAGGSEGLAQSTGVGTTTISATSGGITGSTTLTVTAAVLVSIAVTPQAASLALGSTLQYTATGTFTDATTQDLTTAVTWTSSDAAAATVSNAAGSEGLATAVSVGATTISAISGAITGSATLTTTPAELVSIAVAPQAPTINAGTTVQLTATGTYTDATTADLTAMVVWATQAPTIATVSATGLVTGLRVGTAQIDATLGAIVGSTTVTVTAPAPVVVSTSPADAATAVSALTSIAVNFDRAMDPATLVTQASAGPCTGTIQVSRDDFASCVGLGAVVTSMGNQVATTTPAPALAFGTTYKIRVTTGAQSAVGAALASTFTQATGFTTRVDAHCATGLIISQVYGGGGNVGAPLKNDFIELHNPTAAPISLAGLAVQYAAVTGTTWQVTALPSVMLAPGAFFLIQEGGGTTGSALPTPDVIPTTPINMSAANGKVALTTTATALTGACPLGAAVLDFIGYGPTANCSETAPTPLLSNTTSAQRQNGGCADDGNNLTDFAIAAPAPRNTSNVQSCACTANETNAAAELDFCNLQFPASTSTAAGALTELVFGRAFEAGVTEAGGPNPLVRAEIGVGPVTANPQNQPGWIWAPASYNLQVGNDDEYKLQITAPAAPDTYRYTSRFSIDGENWTYCDLDGAGSNAGLSFDPARLGTLTVTP